MPRGAIQQPELSADDRAALKEYFALYDPLRDRISAELIEFCKGVPELAGIIASMTPQMMAEQQKKQRALERQALVEGDWRPYLENSRTEGVHYAQAGIPFGTWMRLVSAFRTVMRRELGANVSKDSRGWQQAMDGMNLFLDIGMANLGDSYLVAKEQIIGRQAEAIRELSTPVLTVRDRLLIIPIVGMVDTQRARHLTEAMLQGIRDRRAKAVVIDITGVPLVDSKVAGHFAQACEAARLMGAYIIMTGISAEIAQAMVAVGAELKGVPTMSDLQAGIEEAERLLGYDVAQARRHPRTNNGRETAR